MAVTLDDKLVIGVSSRALFDLEEENDIYVNEGLEAYINYQRDHENDVLKPGAAFSLIKALQGLNSTEKRYIEIIVMSKNSADTSLRIFNSIEHYGLDIGRAALVSGSPIAPYLDSFKTDLFLSADEKDVQEAIDADIAAGIICVNSKNIANISEELTQIRIAFDGDAVIFSDESERIYQEKGLDAFEEHERENARNDLAKGPFAKLLKTISLIQKEFPEESMPIRTALVTARKAPAHERVIRTLRAWDVKIDEAFFLGGVEKSEVLEAFRANIFFDDQKKHVELAAKHVPAARVPVKL